MPVYTHNRILLCRCRLLPNMFAYKKMAMMELNNVTKMKLEELIGSLQTYKMKLKMQDQNRVLVKRATNLPFTSTKCKSEDEDDDDIHTIYNVASKLDHLLAMERVGYQPQGLGYKGNDSSSKTDLFVSGGRLEDNGLTHFSFHIRLFEYNHVYILWRSIIP